MGREENQQRDGTHKVVVNHEEQYSIWPAERELPAGWKDAGKIGTKEQCLDHIGQVWTDMRPASLKKRMEGLGALADERNTKA